MRKGSRGGEQDCELILKMDLFQWRLKSCVRCSLEHLGRDFPSYSERGGKGGKKIPQDLLVGAVNTSKGNSKISNTW